MVAYEDNTLFTICFKDTDFSLLSRICQWKLERDFYQLSFTTDKQQICAENRGFQYTR